MKFFKSLFSKFVGLFTSGKAQAAISTVAALIPKALPIVRLIASLSGSRSIVEIEALFEKFAIPYSAAFASLPADQSGKALLFAATTLLAREVPGTPTHILDAAVQLALVGSRAQE